MQPTYCHEQMKLTILVCFPPLLRDFFFLLPTCAPAADHLINLTNHCNIKPRALHLRLLFYSVMQNVKPSLVFCALNSLLLLILDLPEPHIHSPIFLSYQPGSALSSSPVSGLDPNFITCPVPERNHILRLLSLQIPMCFAPYCSVWYPLSLPTSYSGSWWFQPLCLQ